ncbi:MAG: hypothetical protein EBU46_00405, partial [Nitrosomonadaceae bacterium]|nr:hypothetical protein [Nitrosomonadaceae bacterium]
GHPSTAFLSTLTDDLRRGDVIFSTFMLNWRREDSVHPYLLAQAEKHKCTSSEARAKVMKAHIYSRAIGNAKYHGCKIRQLDYWCYIGDTGKTPMFTSGFEVC